MCWDPALTRLDINSEGNLEIRLVNSCTEWGLYRYLMILKNIDNLSTKSL